MAVVATAPERGSNRDSHYPYRFDSHFYYLTGFTEPNACLVLTGEGRIDEQTAFGKTALGVARRAADAGVKAIEAAGLRPSDIDLIVLATATPDQTFPASATIVQAIDTIHHQFDRNALDLQRLLLFAGEYREGCFARLFKPHPAHDHLVQAPGLQRQKAGRLDRKSVV